MCPDDCRRRLVIAFTDLADAFSTLYARGEVGTVELPVSVLPETFEIPLALGIGLGYISTFSATCCTSLSPRQRLQIMI